MKIGGFLSKYLKADDVNEPKLLTVERVDEEDVNGESKFVVYFTECEPGIVLGKTTLEQLIEVFGGNDETEDWIGCAVVAYNDKNVSYQGRKTGGIRFRRPKNPIARKSVQPSANARPSPFDRPVANEDLPF